MQHITLQTGNVVTQLRSSIKHDGIIQELKGMLDPSKHHPLPSPFQDYRLVWFVNKPGDSSNIFGVTTETLYRSNPRACPTLVTCGIADTAELADETWTALQVLNSPEYQTMFFGRAANKPSSLPWLAVSLNPALFRDLSASHWLGDFERCVAWAWLEARQPRETVPAQRIDARWELLLG